MADISQITLNGTTYDIKDAVARGDIAGLESDVAALLGNVGHPDVIDDASEFANADHDKVYAYMGTSITGSYTNGHWYYYKNNTWTDGGVWGSAVAVDDELETAGAAADAEAAGAAIDDLKNSISDIFDALDTSTPKIKELRSVFESGTLDNNGAPEERANRHRTVDFIPINPKLAHYISVGISCQAYVYQYDSGKNYLRGKAIGWITPGMSTISLDTACAYIKLVVSKANDNAASQYQLYTFFVVEVNPASIAVVSSALSFHYGTIKDYTSMVNPNFGDQRAYTNFIPIGGTSVKVMIPNGYKAYIWQYNASFEFVREDGWVVGAWLKGMDPTASYIVITFSGMNGSETVDLETLENNTTVDFLNVRPFRPNDILQNAVLWSHRGASAAPENTLPAIELAIEQGFKAVEVDLEFTSDNVCVLLHDTTINRTSNGTGNIYDMTYQQALQYDFGSWKSAEYAGTKIPTLEQALLLAKRHGIVLQLDMAAENKTNINYDNIVEMCRVIKNTGTKNLVTVCAYHDRMRQILAGFPGLCVTFGLNNMSSEKFTDLALLSSCVTFSNNKASLTVDNSVLYHGLGYLVQTWEIDTQNDYDNYIDNYYVDWVITNTLLPSDIR